jgi:hypothetical protein
VWTTLADGWPKNLKIILHFLISICGVNSEPSLLPYVGIQLHLTFKYIYIYHMSYCAKLMGYSHAAEASKS